MQPLAAARGSLLLNIMKNYIVLLSLLTLAFSLGIIFAGTMMIPDKIDIITWCLLFYFFIITLGFHIGLVNASKGRPQAFVRYYMATTTVKLLLHMMIIVLYALFNKEDAVRFITTFLVFYIIFTVFEVAVAWKQFRAS